MELVKWIDEEIRQSNRATKPINVHFVQTAEGIYKASLPFKIDGDYVLNSKHHKDKGVNLSWHDGQVTMELESEEERINAFLTADNSSLLNAVKQSLRGENLQVEPAFIVGPPGTGKTKVITKVLGELRKNGLKVLMLSSTNMAVENVFERMDHESSKDGEMVLTIKTEQESLEKLSVDSIKKRRLSPIEDELEVLKIAIDEIVKIKRDAQPEIERLRNEKEAHATTLSNLKRDGLMVQHKLKKASEALGEVELRINALASNTLLEKVAKVIMGKKIQELNLEKQRHSIIVEDLQNQVAILDEKILKISTEDNSSADRIKKALEELAEATKSHGEIAEKIKALQKEAEAIRNDNIFDDAWIVGATLFNAALNQRIQNAEFDVIIVDEASMALVPLLIASAQALNSKELPEIEYENDESLYEAQNRAVRLMLKSKLIFVGDPMQLPPIARTYELKKSIFEHYGVEEIFNGHQVANTVLLDTNFRNHPHIVNCASRLFYGGLLKSGRCDDGKDSLYMRKSTSKMVSSEGSYINDGNMRIVVEQARRALERGRRSIGVITPYKKQASKINAAFEELKTAYPDADIQAGTVHTFQGKEKDIIIYDLTYAPAMDGSVPATYQGDIFSSTAKLLNVAMTRAEGFFIVVGDIDGIQALPHQNLILKDWINEVCGIDKKQ